MNPTTSAPSTAGQREIVSLAERTNYLQGLRVGFSVVVLCAALFAHRFIGADLQDVLGPTLAYLGISTAIAALRRGGHAYGLYVVAGMLLIDGVYLAWVTYLTGGTESSLRFLVHLHLIAVTLLASYRTGLKIALWHSLLFFVVFHAQISGILASQDSVGKIVTQPSIFNVMAFWLVALGTAVFSSVNEREIRKRNTDLEALTDMQGQLEDVTEPEAVAEAMLTQVRKTYGFGRAFILAGPGRDLELLAAYGVSSAADESVGLDAIVKRVWHQREAAAIKKVDPSLNPRLARLMPNARNVLVVPMIADGNPLGVLVLERNNEGASRIERRVVAMLGQFASHTALELRNAWLLMQVRRLAQTDELTGLANRRAFAQNLDREVARAEREGSELTLVMLDLDHFKRLNDNYGHLAGDDVLRRAGAALRKACRNFDTAARFGGEEFAVILPSCSTRESFSAAARLRAVLADVEFEIPVTASAGIATFPTHAGDALGLLRAADEALYESKRRGRDCVTRARKMEELPPLRDLDSVIS